MTSYEDHMSALDAAREETVSDLPQHVHHWITWAPAGANRVACSTCGMVRPVRYTESLQPETALKRMGVIVLRGPVRGGLHARWICFMCGRTGLSSVGSAHTIAREHYRKHAQHCPKGVGVEMQHQWGYGGPKLAKCLHCGIRRCEVEYPTPGKSHPAGGTWPKPFFKQHGTTLHSVYIEPINRIDPDSANNYL